MRVTCAWREGAPRSRASRIRAAIHCRRSSSDSAPTHSLIRWRVTMADYSRDARLDALQRLAARGAAQQIDDPAARRMIAAEGEDREHDRNPDEGAEQAPEERPEKHRKQHQRGRYGEHGAGHARL